MASMEMNAAPEEEAVFEGVAESRQTLAFHNTTDPSIQEPEPQQVATLMPGEQGPSKSLQVHSGDTIRLKVNARYETTPAQVQGLEGIATEVVGAVEKTASRLESSGVSEGINGLGATGALANDQQEAPQAHLNYLVYDEDYQLVDQGFVAVSEAAAVGAKNPDAAPEELALEVPIEEDGFVYAYLSNGVANSSTPVYFDDFTVEQQSFIVQVDDFYPFGASFDQNQNRVLANKYLYQDQELQNDLGLNWYQFKWRMHDPLLGRFTSVDPLSEQFYHNSTYAFSENKVIAHIELEGLEAVRAPRPGARRAGGDIARIRSTVADAARIARSKHPSGFATIAMSRGEALDFTRTTTYSTSRGNSTNSTGSSSGTNLGFEDNQHTFGNTAGNFGKVLNDVRSFAQQVVDNAEKIEVTESFAEFGAFEVSLGSVMMVDDVETTMTLSDLEDQYNNAVIGIARGDMSAEEFGNLDPREQTTRILGARIQAGPSPFGIVQQKIQESEEVGTVRRNELYIRQGN